MWAMKKDSNQCSGSWYDPSNRKHREKAKDRSLEESKTLAKGVSNISTKKMEN